MTARIVRHVVASARRVFTLTKLRFARKIVTDHAALQTLGSTAPCVPQFQRRFNQQAAPYGIVVDVSGVYDEQTREAVAQFQREALYVPNGDGFVGPVTARELRIKLLGD